MPLDPDSPEAWLAAQKGMAQPSSTPSVDPDSPEAWMAAHHQSTAPKKHVEGDYNLFSSIRQSYPHDQQIVDTEKIKQDFGRDPSKAGHLTTSDYVKKMLMGGLVGGGVGAGVGLWTGPGAVVSGLYGAGTGALSGLAEAKAEDEGFGKGTQMLAGMVVPSPSGVAKVGGKVADKVLSEATNDLIRKGATTAKDAVSEMVAHKMFGWGAYPLKRAMNILQKSKPIDVKALEAATGVKAASNIQPGSVENVNALRASLANKYGVPVDNAESHVYELAKTKYDQLIGQGKDFTKSPELQEFLKKYPEKEGLVNKLFKTGETLNSGETTINEMKNIGNLGKEGGAQSGIGNNLTRNQINDLRDSFNKFMTTHTGKPWEAEARSASEQMFAAKAKDQLPSLLMNSAKETAGSASARKILSDNIQNFSKTPENRQVFWEETSHALNNMPVSDAKALWNSIGPRVSQYMIRDPEKYQKISQIMSGAKTPKEISNAVRLMIKASAADAVSENPQ